MLTDKEDGFVCQNCGKFKHLDLRVVKPGVKDKCTACVTEAQYNAKHPKHRAKNFKSATGKFDPKVLYLSIKEVAKLAKVNQAVVRHDIIDNNVIPFLRQNSMNICIHPNDIPAYLEYRNLTL